MDDLIKAATDALEGAIDFEGQKLSERDAQHGLILSAIIAFIVGYVWGSVKLSMIVYLVGYVGVMLVTVPPWPFYNKHPTRWLPVRKDKVE